MEVEALGLGAASHSRALHLDSTQTSTAARRASGMKRTAAINPHPKVSLHSLHKLALDDDHPEEF